MIAAPLEPEPEYVGGSDDGSRANATQSRQAGTAEESVQK